MLNNYTKKYIKDIAIACGVTKEEAKFENATKEELKEFEKVATIINKIYQDGADSMKAKVIKKVKIIDLYLAYDKKHFTKFRIDTIIKKIK